MDNAHELPPIFILEADRMCFLPKLESVVVKNEIKGIEVRF